MPTVGTWPGVELPLGDPPGQGEAPLSSGRLTVLGVAAALSWIQEINQTSLSPLRASEAGAGQDRPAETCPPLAASHQQPP